MKKISRYSVCLHHTVKDRTWLVLLQLLIRFCMIDSRPLAIVFHAGLNLILYEVSLWCSRDLCGCPWTCFQAWSSFVSRLVEHPFLGCKGWNGYWNSTWFTWLVRCKTNINVVKVWSCFAVSLKFLVVLSAILKNKLWFY